MPVSHTPKPFESSPLALPVTASPQAASPEPVGSPAAAHGESDVTTLQPGDDSPPVTVRVTLSPSETPEPLAPTEASHGESDLTTPQPVRRSPLPTPSATVPRAETPRPFEPGVVAYDLGDFSIVLEDRWSSAPFQYGWGFVEVNPEWNLQSSATTAVTLSQNQITGGVRWGPLTFWFMEDFTVGHVPGLGPTWFYDSNAPDVAMGLTFTLRP